MPEIVNKNLIHNSSGLYDSVAKIRYLVERGWLQEFITARQAVQGDAEGEAIFSPMVAECGRMLLIRNRDEFIRLRQAVQGNSEDEAALSPMVAECGRMLLIRNRDEFIRLRQAVQGNSEDEAAFSPMVAECGRMLVEEEDIYGFHKLLQVARWNSRDKASLDALGTVINIPKEYWDDASLTCLFFRHGNIPEGNLPVLCLGYLAYRVTQGQHYAESPRFLLPHWNSSAGKEFVIRTIREVACGHTLAVPAALQALQEILPPQIG